MYLKLMSSLKSSIQQLAMQNYSCLNTAIMTKTVTIPATGSSSFNLTIFHKIVGLVSPHCCLCSLTPLICVFCVNSLSTNHLLRFSRFLTAIIDVWLCPCTCLLHLLHSMLKEHSGHNHRTHGQGDDNVLLLHGCAGRRKTIVLTLQHSVTYFWICLRG